ncbi:delta-lactam-biosynthetic de-N-acetylase [Ruminiclostridium josui]|uniref:delta-lactam-biosynthetic de-N-acetylase n=1 Tax=Ruminiclostridium josui TaxID=1499 RepID=UPI000464A19E|nr:delta-lactam-biosynthetic de-N-acetylase [Ruminiclostridium josui]
MKKNKAITIMTLIVCVTLIFAFFIIKKHRDLNSYSEFSDIEGVYTSSSSKVDFSTELTGRLVEGNSLSTEGKVADKSSYPNDKKRCWGMARQPNNQIPRADPGTPELLSKYGAKYLGDVNKKIIYLTFDEGYENGYTAQILDTLRDNNVKAAFFITGPYLKEHQDLVRRMVEEGHTVGNHTIHHPSLPEKSDAQIEEEVVGLERAFTEKFGAKMNFLRPPKGEYSERTLSITSKLGYCNLFWSFAYDDWYRDKVRGPEYTYKVVMRNLHNGEIMLLHAVSKDNADALGMIIKGAREQGYEFGNVQDLAN